MLAWMYRVSMDALNEPTIRIDPTMTTAPSPSSAAADDTASRMVPPSALHPSFRGHICLEGGPQGRKKSANVFFVSSRSGWERVSFLVLSFLVLPFLVLLLQQKNHHHLCHHYLCHNYHLCLCLGGYEQMMMMMMMMVHGGWVARGPRRCHGEREGSKRRRSYWGMRPVPGTID